jgi:predicted aldo/keto reductase-like oxidoreductase
MPVNVVDPVQKSFILNTLPLAQEKNVGVIAMKVFAGGGLHGREITWGNDVGQDRESLIPEIISNREAHHFTLSMPVATATIGCHDAGHVRENIANARSYAKISDAEYKELVEKVTQVALNNTVEHYKAQG